MGKERAKRRLTRRRRDISLLHVMLPSGSTLRLDSLKVQNSITSTTPASSGTFTLPRYTGGPQIVIAMWTCT